MSEDNPFKCVLWGALLSAPLWILIFWVLNEVFA